MFIEFLVASVNSTRTLFQAESMICHPQITLLRDLKVTIMSVDKTRLSGMHLCIDLFLYCSILHRREHRRDCSALAFLLGEGT